MVHLHEVVFHIFKTEVREEVMDTPAFKASLIHFFFVFARLGHTVATLMHHP